jgi:hypothetical protein
MQICLLLTILTPAVLAMPAIASQVHSFAAAVAVAAAAAAAAAA